MGIRAGIVSALALGTSVMAGDLNPPPGPVAPTMLTLDEIETGTPLSQETTPGDADSVFRITTPGEYFLTEILAQLPGKRGIEIAASGVTIDFRGYGIIAPIDGSLEAITFDGLDGEAVDIRNGIIAGADGGGVVLPSTSGVVVEDLTILDVGGDGILLGTDSSVRRCTLERIEETGIDIRSGRIESCVVQDAGLAGGVTSSAFILRLSGEVVGCFARDTASFGFRLLGGEASAIRCYASSVETGFFTNGDGCLFRDCKALSCGLLGYNISASATLIGCVARGGVGAGFTNARATVYESCVAVENGSHGYNVGRGSTLTGCVSLDNRQSGGSGFLISAGSTVQGCTSTNNGGSGFSVQSLFDGGGTIRDCVSRLNAINGFNVLDGWILRGCASIENSGTGFDVGPGSMAIECLARLNAAHGYEAHPGASILRCASLSNTGDGIQVDGAVVRDCTSSENDGNGIHTTGSSEVVNNRSMENAMAGIRVTGDDGRVESNYVHSNAPGISITGQDNTVVRNVANGNVPDYSIGPGNNTGFVTSTPTTAGPWDNIQD